MVQQGALEEAAASGYTPPEVVSELDPELHTDFREGLAYVYLLNK